MKNFFKYILVAILFFGITSNNQAQDKRTLSTKVADILAQFPANDCNYSDKLIKEIINLGEPGITGFCDMIVPPGTGDDTQARYAIESLARYSGAPSQEQARKLVSSTLLKAIDKASDKEVKAFFIRRLKFCGSDDCVNPMAELLNDKKLSGPAVVVLTSIGTEKAASAILAALDGTSGNIQIELIKALGILQYKSATASLIALAKTQGETKRQALAALASIGDPQAMSTFVSAAKAVKYCADNSETMFSYLRFANSLAENGNKSDAKKICNTVLKACKKQEQLIFRSSAIKTLRDYWGTEATATLLKEISNSDKAYRAAVLKAASEGMTNSEVKQWVAVINKVPEETKIQIISTLANRPEATVLSTCILPSLDDSSIDVRIAAIQALATNQKRKATPILLKQLDKASQENELVAIKSALLQCCTTRDCTLLANKLDTAQGDKAILLLEIMAERHATGYFNKTLQLCSSKNAEMKALAFSSLKTMSSPDDLDELINLLKRTNDNKEINETQQAIITALKTGEANENLILQEINKPGMKTKLLPVSPYINSDEAFSTVTTIIENGSNVEKQAAYDALLNWGNTDAIPYLFSIIENGQFASSRKATINTYLEQVLKADFPDDQKLLLVRKLFPISNNNQEKTQIIKAAGKVKTFLSLVFVSEFLDNSELSAPAARASMKIMLPSPGTNNGLQGDFVRSTAQKVLKKLTGNDSRYSKIDIREYLEKMPADKGFVSIFNGKDLSGWQGLVGNPISRSKMNEKELSQRQEEANKLMHEHWAIKDATIVFNGTKYDNICSIKKYADFEMFVDWRITKNGDSGIYLRGTPQVQIWDIARVDVGAQVGSGGLYNNKNNPSKPLVLADNPVGDWNTFRIKMVGEKVTVYLNGQLVVDNVTLENYWDRKLPIFAKEAIELQAHGTDLAFRNVYVREIDSDKAELSEQEKAEGFQLLFNGKNLDGWTGNKTNYVAKNGEIAVSVDHGHGNLYTEKEYSNFIFRFEFKLTPGANNGLGIHAPLEGDAAYVGKELQILDNTAAIYANLKPYQYHGSVYGTIAAKRGFLKPVGEWNSEEVIVKGNNFKIILNGEVILDGNVKEASKNGTADHKDHPGLQRHTGHIGFLGHGSELWLRNIRIKEL